MSINRVCASALTSGTPPVLPHPPRTPRHRIAGISGWQRSWFAWAAPATKHGSSDLRRRCCLCWPFELGAGVLRIKGIRGAVAGVRRASQRSVAARSHPSGGRTRSRCSCAAPPGPGRAHRRVPAPRHPRDRHRVATATQLRVQRGGEARRDRVRRRQDRAHPCATPPPLSSAPSPSRPCRGWVQCRERRRPSVRPHWTYCSR